MLLFCFFLQHDTCHTDQNSSLTYIYCFFSGFVFATIDSSAKGVTFPAVSVCIFVSLCFFLYLQEVQEIYGKNVRVDEISGFFFYLGWIKEGMWLLSRGLKLR